MSKSGIASVLFAPPDQLEERRSGRVVEVSDTGMFIATNSIWPPQTALVLILEIPGERLPARLSGEVEWARTRDVAGIFVRFTEPEDHPTREKLRAPRAKADETPRDRNRA